MAVLVFMKLGIGIDTGGTYTDAVVCNFKTKEILGASKALTTKDDLSLGILEAIDGLPKKLVHQAELISLSTTLATNACVEDKGGDAKLIFFGGDAKVIDEMGGKYGLPPSKDILIQDSFTKFSGEPVREPDWDAFQKEIGNDFEHLDGVGIIEMNAMHNGALAEKKAKEIFQNKYDIPVVCGHELFSELNSLQRGASTLLNARLFPVIREFLSAVKKALLQRGIHATLVIMRSDGSLMSEEFASTHPVETLLCGPAASTIGGMRLGGAPNSLIVDMGGTTTDISIVSDNKPVTVIDGVSIGKWKTFVDGLYVRTFGLGGDTAIHYRDQKLYLEEYRIVPLCVAAHQHPEMLESLRDLAKNKRKHTKFLYEHYLLIKDISSHPRYTDEEKAFCEILKNGPLPITEAAEAVKKDIYTLNVERLLKDGVVQLCGLTPTDIMHIKKDFTRYRAEASLLGAEFVAYNLNLSIGELCELVYREIKRKMYANIVEVLLENKYRGYMKNGISREIEAFIDENYEMARTGNRDSLLSMMFRTEYALVGIGAPIRIFLDDVAALLGTRAVFPEHYEVANALGSIIGDISASCTIEIKPNVNSEGIDDYIVYGLEENRHFDEIEEAEKFAISEAERGAREKAVSRGASGNLTVKSRILQNEADSKICKIYLGTAVTATAVGTVSFEWQ